MQLAIAAFNSETDGGDTPYLGALQLAYQTIAADPDLQTTGSSAPVYFILFLSDGYPTDAVNPDGSTNIAAISQSVNAITRLASGKIKLSTAYYGTINDANAARTLSQMAATGNGVFVNVDTSSTSSIDLSSLFQTQSGACNL